MVYQLALIVSLIVCSITCIHASSLNNHLTSSLHKIASHYGLSSKESMKLVSLTDPKTQILDQLNSLLTELRTEQNDALTQHLIFGAIKAQERVNLQQTLDSIQGQVTDIENQINENQGNIGSMESEESELQAQANEADSQVKLYEALLERLNQDHVTAVANYDDIIKQHTNSLLTLQQLIDMVSNFQFNDALVLLSKQQHQFLHRNHAGVALLVQTSIELIQNKGPKNDIKQKLLDLLNQIKQGTIESRALYVQEAQNEVEQFNEQSSSLTMMINNFKIQRDLALAQLADLIAQKIDEQDSLDLAQGSLDNLQGSIATIGDAISALDAELNNENDQFNAETQDHVNDMNDIEAAIQYVNDHVEGMSVHSLCHIGAPDCYRCLTSSDCNQGQECSDDGKCEAKERRVLIGGTADENSSLNLACPEGHVIGQIKFASYGMATGEFPDFVISDWCDATSSMGVVSSLCTGQQTCSVAAVNDVFGDPCHGTVKHISVTAVCF